MKVVFRHLPLLSASVALSAVLLQYPLTASKPTIITEHLRFSVCTLETSFLYIPRPVRPFDKTHFSVIRLGAVTDAGHPLAGLSTRQVPRWSLT